MMISSRQVSACNYVINWLSRNHERLGLQQTKLELVVKTLAANYETPRHLIDICAWDHAYCLDILAFDQSTGALVFSEAGPCDSTEGLQDRLNAFANWASIHRGDT